MRLGCPKEIKIGENRVGLLPASVRELVESGHQVLVESGAGLGAGFEDSHYVEAGAVIAKNARIVFESAALVVKVKEPQPQECEMLWDGQTLFTYLHLAADQKLTEMLLRSGVTGIAYETIEDQAGRLPLLAPMSEVAGRLAIQAAARCLEKHMGGRGILLSGVPGVRPAQVLIVGAGIVGKNALAMAVGAGADVTIADLSMQRLREIDDRYSGRVKTVYASSMSIAAEAERADVIVGAVLVSGARAPMILSRSALKRLKPGAVLVDVSIDQGGCFETSRPTTHIEPTYIVDGIVHYCVANMPGAVPRTSTLALNNATLPYVKSIASLRPRKALQSDPGLRKGLNVCAGKLTNAEIAAAFSMSSISPDQALAELQEFDMCV